MSIVSHPAFETVYSKLAQQVQSFDNSESETVFSKTEAYDTINGFSPDALNCLIDLLDPTPNSKILDAMAGDGNLTCRLYNHCKREDIDLPEVTLLDTSKVQCEIAKAQLAHTPAKVICRDVLTLQSRDGSESISKDFFDKVMLKSATHEIPLENQIELYRNLLNALKPGGMLISLGFVFDDKKERNEYRDIARVKDTLAGFEHVTHYHHFLTREEFYSSLQDAGFTEIQCMMHVPYTIKLALILQQYFPKEKWDHVSAELQMQQARSMMLRRRGRILFHGDTSTMILPGEITIARRPVEG